MKRFILLFLILSSAVTVLAQHWPIGIVSVQDTTKKVQFGLVSSVATDGGQGLQFAGFSNMSAQPFRGIQLSGVSNISRGLPRTAPMIMFFQKSEKSEK